MQNFVDFSYFFTIFFLVVNAKYSACQRADYFCEVSSKDVPFWGQKIKIYYLIHLFIKFEERLKWHL